MELTLLNAQSASHRGRVRLTVAVSGCGFVLLLVACVGWMLFFGWVPSSFGTVGEWWLGGGPCFALLLIAVLPTDDFVVRAAAAVCTIAFTLFACACFVATAVFLQSGCGYAGSYGFHGTPCKLWAVALGLGGLANTFQAIYLLRKTRGDVPTRSKLSALWFALRFFYTSCGGLLIAFMPAIAAADASLRASRGVWSYFACGCGWVVFNAISTPRNRQAVMGRLKRIGASSDVAALVERFDIEPYSDFSAK